MFTVYLLPSCMVNKVKYIIIFKQQAPPKTMHATEYRMFYSHQSHAIISKRSQHKLYTMTLYR